MRYLLVCGSRGFGDEDFVRLTLDRLLRKHPEGFELMHGGAEGPDTDAYWWALDHEEVIGRSFLPDYRKHGRRAPHVRNDRMLGRADFVLAFWDGKSRGTRSVIQKAMRRGIAYEVHAPWGTAPGGGLSF